jgi:hypothetical protein
MKRNSFKYQENKHQDFEEIIDIDSNEPEVDEDVKKKEQNQKKKEMVDWLVKHQKRDPLKTNRPMQIKALNELIHMQISPQKIKDVLFECEASDFWQGKKEKPDFVTVKNLIQKRG